MNPQKPMHQGLLRAFCFLPLPRVEVSLTPATMSWQSAPYKRQRQKLMGALVLAEMHPYKSQLGWSMNTQIIFAIANFNSAKSVEICRIV